MTETRSQYLYIALIGALSLVVGYTVANTFLPTSGSDLLGSSRLSEPMAHREDRASASAPVAAVAPAQVAADEVPDTADTAETPDTPAAPAQPMDPVAFGLSRLAVGRELLEAGDLEAGYLAYRDAVELYPSAETHRALGGLYFRIAARDKAYIQLRKAAELDPYNADLWLDLANAEHMRTAVGQEWKAVQRARDADPDLVIARDESGYYYRDENDPKAFTTSGSYTLRRIP